MEKTLSSICQRADICKFLSECYYLPDEQLMGKVAEIAQSDAFFAELTDHIPPTVDLESLRVDYSRLFVGPYKLLAPPYGSVYLEDNRLMGESTMDVKSCYEAEGLDIVLKEAPDHITMELEFVYYLITKQAQAIENADLQMAEAYKHKQLTFLSSHLSRWLTGFSENVQKNAQTDFYKTLARLTELFIQKDMDACA